MKPLKLLSIYLLLTTFIISCTKDNVSQDQVSETAENIKIGETSVGEVKNLNFNSSSEKNSTKQHIENNEGKRVGLLGADYINWRNLYIDNGNEVVDVDANFISNGGLANLDVLFYFRNGTIANSYIAEIKEFVNNGGTLITEFSATDNVIQNFEFISPATILDNFYFPSGSVVGGNEIFVTSPSHALATGLPSSFISGNQLGVFYIYEGLSSEFETIATLDHDANGDGENDPVVSSLCIGEGVWISFFADFGDLSGSYNVEAEIQMSLNAVEIPVSCGPEDNDNDGVIDIEDNCPLDANSDQADNDSDGIGDVCDPDDDNDGVVDIEDNCLLDANSDQADNDSDGIGDVCDPDDDNDGVVDIEDNCPLDGNSDQADFDNDGMGDVCDPDDDNDGILDEQDANPLSNTEASISIGDCDSGAENEQLNDGVFMSDLIDELEAGDYKNLGQEIRSYTELTNKWIQDGIITADQRSQILNCVQE